jgi:hypothetical protein
LRQDSARDLRTETGTRVMALGELRDQYPARTRMLVLNLDDFRVELVAAAIHAWGLDDPRTRQVVAAAATQIAAEPPPGHRNGFLFWRGGN